MENKITFTIKEEHIVLCKEARFITTSNIEYRAPQADAKRPYGSSQVEHDIIEILGLEEEATTIKDGMAVLKPEYREKAKNLHGELQNVLAILSDNPTDGIEVGEKYERNKYGGTWTKTND